jgi:hypothetical protein
MVILMVVLSAMFTQLCVSIVMDAKTALVALSS